MRPVSATSSPLSLRPSAALLTLAISSIIISPSPNSLSSPATARGWSASGIWVRLGRSSGASMPITVSRTCRRTPTTNGIRPTTRAYPPARPLSYRTRRASFTSPTSSPTTPSSSCGRPGPPRTSLGSSTSRILRRTSPCRRPRPVEANDAIANGYSGKPNPSWDSLPADRREDLARRMATFAAMVEHVDQGVGRLLADLEQHGELANTLILFTSDNGACYEWGPFGFDGVSRSGQNDLHVGESLAGMGQAGTHSSYGSAWANLGNTPLNLYKHFCNEGGISSPLIVSWPATLKPSVAWIRSSAHVMDFLPTIAAAAGATYPAERAGKPILPSSGRSLLPDLRGEPTPERGIPTAHEGARGYRLGNWKIVWGKRQAAPVAWQLFDLSKDPSEQHDLAEQQPEKLKELADAWMAWAKRCGVDLGSR
ncbi:MAG: hypothetical protein EBS64_06785 [Verrucomicrobia bacterium]|nr:hypothetical protein [Verrucomicrobiota bacterium]